MALSVYAMYYNDPDAQKARARDQRARHDAAMLFHRLSASGETIELSVLRNSLTTAIARGNHKGIIAILRTIYMRMRKEDAVAAELLVAYMIDEKIIECPSDDTKR